MEIMKIKPEPDTLKIVTDSQGIAFTTQRNWYELSESSWEVFNGMQLVTIKPGSDSVLLVLNCIIPGEAHKPDSTPYHLVKINRSEDDKLVLHGMDLTLAEGMQICQSRLSFWD